MKLTLVALLTVVCVTAMSASAADVTLFQDGDFTSTVIGDRYTSAGTAGTGIWTGAAGQVSWSVTPTGGNPGAFLNHLYSAGVKVTVGVPAPAAQADWTIKFDSQWDSGYFARFMVEGMTAGGTVENWGGGVVVGGTQLGATYNLDANTNGAWVTRTVNVTVPAGYDSIALVWELGSDSAGIRGIDNVLVTIPGAASAHPGDANNDGFVDVGDLGILGANYGKTSGMTWATADFTGDGAVDVGDLGILGANYGWPTAGAVPEPATLSLLALGALSLIRRAPRSRRV